jgi:hypothetical protein
VLTLCASSAWSQSNSDSSSGVPDGPLLRPAPGFSQWVITYSYAEDRAPKPTVAPGQAPLPTPAFVLARPRTIVTTKTGSIVHELVTDLQQHERENWYVGARQYRKDQDSPVWLEYEPDPHPDIHYSPLPANGFRDLDWISSRTYSGRASQAGQSCLVFKTTEKVKSLDSALPLGKEYALVAYIDAKTRLPVEVDIDKETRTYQFDSPPSGMQALPDDLTRQIKTAAAGRAIMSQQAARPF